MARELPNPERGTTGQIPKIQSDGSYGLSSDSTGGSGSGNATIVNPGDNWVPIVETASPGDIIHFRPGTHKDTTHSDTNEGPVIVNTDDLTLYIESGATVMARDGLSQDERFIQLRADNTTITGGGTIDGNAAMSDGLATNPPSYHGHEHVVDANWDGLADPVTNLLIDGITIQNAGGGDGIYLNDCHNAILRNIHIDKPYRIGITITDATDVIIDNFIVENVNGVAPNSCIGVEPITTGENVDRITISNGIVRNAANHGIYVNTMETNQLAGGDKMHMTFRNVTAHNNGWRGFSLHETTGAERLHFKSCAAVGNARTGFYMAGSGNMRLDNCTGYDNGYAANSEHEVGITAEWGDVDNSPADVTVNGFEAFDFAGNQKYPGTALHGSTLRVIDARTSGHTAGDGFRAEGTGSVVEHHLVRAADGTPAIATNGGSTTLL